MSDTAWKPKAQLGPLTASDVARVQARLAVAAKAVSVTTPGSYTEWQSWQRIAFWMEDLHRDQRGG